MSFGESLLETLCCLDAEFFDFGFWIAEMENDQRIEIEIDVKADDYRRILFWHNRPQILIYLIGFFLGIVMLVFVIFDEDTNANYLLKIGCYFILFTMPWSLFFVIFSIWRRSKLLEKKSEKSKINFDNYGVEINSETTSFKTTWDRYNEIYETKDDIVLSQLKGSIFQIPKRFFNSSDQITEFKNLVIEKLGEKAKFNTNL